MDKFQRTAVKAAAAGSVAGSGPRRLVLLHTGVTLLLSCLLSVLDYVLQQQIGAAPGLGGISERAALSTVQTLLRYAQLLAMPLWNCGYLAVCLRLSRQEYADGKALLCGFPRFGPILRLTILQGLVYLVLGIVCVYISSSIFMFTPWAAPFLEAMEPLLASGEISEELLTAALEPALVPLALLFGLLFLGLALPVHYALRFADFIIMDTENPRARAAMKESLRLTRGSRRALFQLDLSFWWYYGLEILVLLLCYGDLLLSSAGIRLPWSADGSYFLFLLLSSAAQLALYAWKKNEVFVTFAHTYAALRHSAELPQIQM